MLFMRPLNEVFFSFSSSHNAECGNCAALFVTVLYEPCVSQICSIWELLGQGVMEERLLRRRTARLDALRASTGLSHSYWSVMSGG